HSRVLGFWKRICASGFRDRHDFEWASILRPNWFVQFGSKTITDWQMERMEAWLLEKARVPASHGPHGSYEHRTSRRFLVGLALVVFLGCSRDTPREWTRGAHRQIGTTVACGA